MEYNVVKHGNKEAYIIKNKTTFKVVKELLGTDYLNTVTTGFIKDKCVHNPNLSKGVLVSNRRSLKAKLAKERMMSDVVMNRFLEQEIPEEQYSFLQQYVGNLILNNKGAENIFLNLGRGVNEEYFRKKGIKLAKLNQNAKWRLAFVKDIVFGHCSLGHEIRYAFTAINDSGDSLIFGSTCVHDFFEIDEQLSERLVEYVNQIRTHTEDYYNDYHSYYEIHRKQDQFMALLMKFVNSSTNEQTFNKTELNFMSKFIGYGLPIPKPLAEQVGDKIMDFFAREYSMLVAFEPYDIVTKLIYLCGCFAYGCHGTTVSELNTEFPVNYLGDRIMPKEVEHFKEKFNSLKTGTTNNDFIQVMTQNLNINQFVMLLNNVSMVKKLTGVLAQDDILTLEPNPTETGYKLTYKEITLSKQSHISSKTHATESAKRMNLLFGLPTVETREDALKIFMNQQIQLKLDKSVLATKDFAYLSMFEYEEGVSVFSTKLNPSAEKLKNFMHDNEGKVVAEDLVLQILNNDFVNKDKPKGLEWFSLVIQENNVAEAMRSNKQRTGVVRNRSDFPIEKYEELLEKAIKHRDIVDKKRKGFAVDILKSVVTYKKISPKQQKFVDDLENVLQDV
ncbi:hypothetical protein ACQUY5_24485 [Bacillus cereus]|uniref:hypothetical protein n=1 Tax=Bacillus cereus TaxID=1396 RepID=UPI003D164A60